MLTDEDTTTVDPASLLGEITQLILLLLVWLMNREKEKSVKIFRNVAKSTKPDGTARTSTLSKTLLHED